MKFSLFRKEVCPVQLYGKLPLAKDYLRIGGGQGAGIALREWLDLGFSSMAERERPPRFAWPARFLLGGYNGEPIQGCAWPSTDSGALRKFPFVVFVERRRKALTEGWGAGAEGLIPVWQDLASLFSNQGSFPDGQSFLAAMRNHSISVEEHTHEARRVDLGVWCDALWPGEGEAGLVDALTQLGSLKAQGYRGPLRVPTVTDLSQLTQVYAWWIALVELGLLHRGDTPGVVFPIDGPYTEATFCTFFLGALRPEEAQWVSRVEQSLGEGDLCSSAPRSAEGAPPPAKRRRPLPSPCAVP